MYPLGDQQNRIMGYAVIRQIRVRPNTCRVHPSFRKMTRVCALQSAIVNEDSRDFCDGWVEMNDLTQDLPSCQREVKFVTKKFTKSFWPNFKFLLDKNANSAQPCQIKILRLP